jgi:hypothetical protein
MGNLLASVFQAGAHDGVGGGKRQTMQSGEDAIHLVGFLLGE